MKILSNHILNLIAYGKCKQLTFESIEIEKQTYVSIEIYLKLYAKLLLKSKDKYFGLHFGFFLNLKALGSVYDISMATTNIAQTIQIWSDYASTNFPLVKFKSYKDKDCFFLELDSEIKDSNLKNQILDTIFTFVFRELSLLINNKEIDVSVPYPNTDIHSKWFKCTIKQSSKHLFTFKQSILNKEISSRTKEMLELLLPKFLMMLSNKKNQNNSFAVVTKEMILNMCSPELPNLKFVAYQFSMTERTFQRKLKAEGTSYRKITNEIKSELSFYLKKGKKLKTKDIAYMLGYSSSSSFLHANNNWS